MTTTTVILCLLTAPVVFGAILNRLARKQVADLAFLGCVGISLVFLFTGSGHFILTAAMVEMLPPWVPARMALVYFTGVIEIVTAVAVLVPSWRRVVGGGLILMLVVFLPVNIYAALNRVEMGGHEWGPIYLLVRAPLQAILVGWIWWYAVRPGALKPIRFSCRETLGTSPEQIAAQILDLGKWTEFQGYGILPGIKQAEFAIKTAEITGTRIRVTNRDGSSHIEEIVEWQPERLRLHMHEFSPPLSRLATGFDETWEFERAGRNTTVVRSFELHPGTVLAWPILLLISRLLKRAIVRHLEHMKSINPISG